MEQRRRRFGPPEITFRGRPVFYGWWVVGGSFLLTSLGGGFYIHGFSPFISPLAEQFDVGLGTVALVFAAATGSEAVFGPVLGYLIDRFGSRRMMLVGVPIFAAGFFLLSLAPSLLFVFLVFPLVIAPGVSLGVFTPGITAVSHWFLRRRSTALSIATVGLGAGGLFVLVLQFLIDEFDWRIAARAAAVVILVVGFPIALLVMRDRPQDIGEVPDGEPLPEGQAREPYVPSADFTPREALASPAFWKLVLWFGLRMFVVASISIHFIPLIVAKDFSAAQAAVLLAIFAVAAIPCRLSLGLLADRVSKNLLAAVLGLVQLAALAILFTAQEFWQLIAFALVYAVSWGGSGANLNTAIRADYFGLRFFATIGGMFNTLMVIGIVVGPPLTGLIYDRTGSYDIALWAFFAATAASTAIVLFTPQPKPKRSRH